MSARVAEDKENVVTQLQKQQYHARSAGVARSRSSRSSSSSKQGVALVARGAE